MNKVELSPQFTAEDGIDQGDTISPLLWRIFYDPLLSALQKNSSRGYKMKVNWPLNINNPLEWSQYKVSI